MSRARPKIRASREFLASLRTLHPEIRRKLRTALDHLLDGKTSGKALQDRLAGFHSLRVGKFRAIYRVEPTGVVAMVMFGPRSTVYRETLRALSRSDRTDD